MTIREEMPVLAKHEGKWEGVYTTVDEAGNILDQHNSLLTCKFPTDDSFPYHQTNEYTWNDGKKETFQFPATYADKKIHFDTDRIKGEAWEVDDYTVLLKWDRKDIPNTYLYEMIQISQDGKKRSRTWHWFENDKLTKRTLIEENKLQ